MHNTRFYHWILYTLGRVRWSAQYSTMFSKNDPKLCPSVFKAIKFNVWCSTYNYVTLQVDPDNPKTDIIIAAWYCWKQELTFFCKTHVHYDEQWLVEKPYTPDYSRPYGWVHVCLDFDFRRMNLTIAFDNKVLFARELASKFDLTSPRVTWRRKANIFAFNFPEMFTQLNIYSRFVLLEWKCLYKLFYNM